MKKKNQKIIFVVPYPEGSAPGQRFRFEQYLGILREAGFQLTINAFLDPETNRILYKKGFLLKKALGVIKGFLNRLLLLLTISKYDFIYIYREASPLGPPFFEWIAARLFRKKIIYDFDDAIWLPNTSTENKLVSKLKWHGKVAQICKWSYKLSCGNPYLCRFALQHNPKVVLNPTTIDTENLHHPELYGKLPEGESQHAEKDGEKILTIGWTGSHSTLFYLDQVLPVLQKLEEKYEFIFLVIADRNPQLPLKNFQFLPWNKETEIRDLLKMDIGLMPLKEDPWSHGKCGFKALQYLSLEIAAVVSPIGVNLDIVDDGVNSYLCYDENDWYQKIESLLLNPQKRAEFGLKGREKVIQKFSVLSNRGNFLRLFD